MTLSTIERVLFLRGVKLFSQIPGEELVSVAHMAREVTFRANDRFITQGDIGDCLYVVVDGTVDIVIEEAGLVAQRRPKDVLGEMAVISRTPRTAHCIARTDVTLLQIDHDDFWDLMAEKSELALGVIHVLVHLLNEAVENIRILGGKNTNGASANIQSDQ